MYAVIELPHLPLQAVTAELTAPERRRAIVVIDSGVDRVIDLNRAAAAAGVESGTSAARARARCSDLQLLARGIELEHSLHEQLLDLACLHSPDVESTEPGLVTIDLAHRPGPARQHVEKMLEGLRSSGLHARAGLADEPDPARLAAALGRPVFELPRDPQARRSQLADQSIDILPLEVRQRQTLHLWGVRTLGQFARLPGDGLVERLGPGALRLRSLAQGRGARLLRLHREPEALGESLSLEHSIDRLEPLLFVLRRLLDTLLARVLATWRSVEAMRLKLIFEDGGEHQAHLPLAEPGCDPGLLTRVLQTHLESLSAPAAVVELTLELQAGDPASAQRDLFHQDLRAPSRFAETLARLQALLGSDHVGRPRPLDSHRPDSFRLEPYPLEAVREPAVENQPSPVVPGPPMRRFRPPWPVRVECDSGGRPLRLHAATAGQAQQVSGAVQRYRGPWVLAGHWWDHDQWRICEWDVQLSRGGPVYRLVQSAGNWHVCGVYD